MKSLSAVLSMLLVGPLGLSETTRAQPVTWQIHAEVRALTNFDDPNAPLDAVDVERAASLGIAPGTPVDALLTFEPTTPDAFGVEGTLDDYPGALLDFRAAIGSLTVGGPGYPPLTSANTDLLHGDNPDAVRTLSIDVYFYAPGTGFRTVYLYLGTTPASGDAYFPIDHLPIDPPPGAALTAPPTCPFCGGPASVGTNLAFDILSSPTLINATVLDIRRVPEPAAASLVALMLLAVRGRR